MLTVKFRNEKTRRTRNVECVEAIVDPARAMATVLLKKADGTTESVEVHRLNGADDDHDFHIAFVQNSHGSTVEVVRP